MDFLELTDKIEELDGDLRHAAGAIWTLGQALNEYDQDFTYAANLIRSQIEQTRDKLNVVIGEVRDLAKAGGTV